MHDSIHKGAYPKLFNLARENRKAPTEAEKVMWHHLRNRKLAGFKFRRQHPLYDFIVDFYCHDGKLIVEIDGDVHLNSNEKEYDEDRTGILNEFGLSVLRLTNDEVIQIVDGVLKRIRDFLSKTGPTR